MMQTRYARSGTQNIKHKEKLTCNETPRNLKPLTVPSFYPSWNAHIVNKNFTHNEVRNLEFPHVYDRFTEDRGGSQRRTMPT